MPLGPAALINKAGGCISSPSSGIIALVSWAQRQGMTFAGAGTSVAFTLAGGDIKQVKENDYF